MATLTSSNLNFILDEVTSAVSTDAAFEGSQVTPSLFTMRAMMGRRERISSIGSLDNWSQKGETAAAGESEVVQQYQKTITPNEYAQAVKYSRILADDEEWGEIARLSQGLGDSFAQTVEQLGADLINDIPTGASYTAEDGKSIANNAHTNVDGGNSQDNLGANSLTMAGLKASRTAMRKTTNYRGNSFSRIRPDLILCPVDLEQDAFELVKSSMRPDNANMAANINAGALSVLAWEEMSSTTAWAMADLQKLRRNLLFLFRTPLEFFGSGDVNTGTRTVGGYARFTLDALDWRPVYWNAV